MRADANGGPVPKKKKKKGSAQVTPFGGPTREPLNPVGLDSFKARPQQKQAPKQQSSANALEALFGAPKKPKDDFKIKNLPSNRTNKFTESMIQPPTYGDVRNIKAPKQGNPWDAIITPLDKQTPVGKSSNGMLDFLQQIKDPKAPKGYVGPDINAPGVVPRKFKLGPDGKLAPEWDPRQIEAQTAALAGNDFEYNKYLNDTMEARYKDQEDNLLGKNFNKIQRIRKVLEKGQKLAFEDKNFTYLEEVLEKHPDLLKLPEFDDNYGVTAQEVNDQWLKETAHLSDEDRERLSYNVKPLMKHLENLEKGYFTTFPDVKNPVTGVNKMSYKVAQDTANQLIERYTKNIQKSIDYAKDKGTPEQKKAAELREKNGIIPKLHPKNDKEVQDVLDAYAKEHKVTNEGMSSLLGAPLGMGEKEASKKLDKGGKKDVDEIKASYMKDLGLKNLPTLKDMLAIKVKQGSLDPSDEDAVNAEMDRLSNPVHPDTKAMYAMFAAYENPELREDPKKLEEFVMGDVIKWTEERNKAAGKQAKLDEEAADKAATKDRQIHTGFWDGFSDAAKETGRALEFSAESALDAVTLPFRTGADIFQGEGINKETVTGENFGALGWTFDKLMRPLNAVAGYVDAVYAMDEDQNSSWSGENGVVNGLLGFVTFDPLRAFTGQSMWDSADEAFKDPSKLLDPVNASYQQGLRGSGLPGLDDDTTPMLWKHVIASQALRDSDQNVYDEEWYQHVAGGLLDLGTDPLNAIGTGIVSGALKLPVGAARNTAKVTGNVIGRSDFLTRYLKFNQPGLSPAAEKAMLARNSLEEVGNTTDERVLTTGRNLYSKGGFIDPRKSLRYEVTGGYGDSAQPFNHGPNPLTHRDIENYHIQRNVFADETGVMALQKSSNELLEAALAARPMEIRVSNILKDTRNRTPIYGEQGYYNYGGMWTDWVKKIEAKAKATGRSKVDYVNDADGILLPDAYKAKRAQRELDEMSAFPVVKGPKGQLGADDLVRTKREAELNAQIAKAEESGALVRKADIDAYIRDVKTDPKLAMPKTGWTPDSALAKAMNLSPTDFKSLFNEEDVMRAVLEGPMFLRASDDAARKTWEQGVQRAAEADRQLKGLAGLPAEQAKQVKANALAAAAIGHTMQSEVTIAGTIRYLEVLNDARRAGKYTDTALSNELRTVWGDLLTQKAKLPEGGASDDMGDYLGGFAGARNPVTDQAESLLPIRNGNYEGYNFRGQSAGDVLAHQSDKFKTQAEQIDSAIKEIKTQLHGLRTSTKITGFPPKQAHQIKDILKPGSSFLKADGAIDLDKVKAAFPDENFKFGEANESLKLSYTKPPKPENGTLEQIEAWRADVAFLDIIHGGIISEARGAFRGQKTAILARKNAEAKTVEVSSIVAELKPGVSKVLEAGLKADPASPVGRGARAVDSMLKSYPEYTDRIQRVSFDGKGRGSEYPVAVMEHEDGLAIVFNADLIEAEVVKAKAGGGKKWSVAHRNAKTEQDMYDSILVHELAHVVHDDLLKARNLPTGSAGRGADELVDELPAVSDYAKKNRNERFAEWFAAKHHGEDVPHPGFEDLIAKSKIKADPEAPKESEFFGPETEKLGLRPTAESFRRDNPSLFKKTREAEVKPHPLAPKPPKDTKLDRIQEKMQKGEDLHPNEQRYLEDVLEQHAKDAEASVAKAPVGPKTSGQIKWTEALLKAQRIWDSKYPAAKKADLEAKQVKTPSVKLTADEYAKASLGSFKEAKAGILKSLEDTGTVPKSPTNMRATIAQTEAQARHAYNLKYKYDKAMLKIKQIKATTPNEISSYETQLRALENHKTLFEKDLKERTDQAKTVVKLTKRAIREDELVQLLSAPAKMSQDAIQFTFAGMNKNITHSNSLFNGAEKMAALVPAAFRTRFMEYFYRPTKLLDQGQESILLRAQYTSNTPVVIAATLKILRHQMGGVLVSQREAMLRAYRLGRDYQGKNAELVGGVNTALADTERVLNGTHPLYFVTKNRGATGTAVTLPEIMRYVPTEWKVTQKALDAAYLERMKLQGPKAVIDDANVTKLGMPKVSRDDEFIALNYEFGNPELKGVVASQKQLDLIQDLGGDVNIVRGLRGQKPISDYITKLQATKNNLDAAKALETFSPVPTAVNQYTIDDYIKAVVANEYATPKDLHDPFRLAWTIRMAAGQAQQLGALKNGIENTFGVVIPKLIDARDAEHLANIKSKHSIAKQLQRDAGWRPVEGFDSHTLFPPEALNDIKQLMRLTEPGEAAAGFTKLADQAIGYWKQGMTIYNPGYYTRNGVGEVMVSWLDGVSHPKWYRYAGKVRDFEKATGADMEALLKRWSVMDGVVKSDAVRADHLLFKTKHWSLTAEEGLRWYYEMGLKSTFANTDIGTGVGVRNAAGSTLKEGKASKGVAKLNEKVHDVGEGFEDYLRMAHFLHAMNRSGAKTVQEAAKFARTRVVRSHFDYTDFSQFEKSVMLRVFPFYKWTRRGAPLMLAHLFMTPGKMTAIPKMMNTASGLGLDPSAALQEIGNAALPGNPLNWTEDSVLSTQDIDEDKNGILPNYSGIAPAWVKDLFAYQMNPTEDDEYGNYFRIQTPQIDGLNAAFNFVPGDGKSPLGMFGDSAAYPLLNPVIKAGLELPPDGMLPGSLGNKGLDPDFPYEIYGGDFNKAQGLSPLESLVTYGMRNANPWSGFMAKLAKNNALAGDANLGENGLGPKALDPHYKQNAGYETYKDWLSQLTGAGFYQAIPGKAEDAKPQDPPAVGNLNLEELSMFSGRKAASKSDVPQSLIDMNNLVESVLKNIGINPDNEGTSGNKYSKNGYRKYGRRKWRNYGGGSSGGDFNIWALIQAMRATIEEAQS